ncbi:MAG: class I SAM-dependent methyltransferase [Deltaproteobacteria bacterium]|nr:class I SAM-dependent methyltransferase [Deltaproteobacteria bacterium]
MVKKFKLIKDRQEVIEPYVTGKSVLDIGCADARLDGRKRYKSTGLHEFIKERASRLLGVDCDEEGVECMREDGYDVVTSNAEEMELNERFDCVMAGEIIEHLSNPAGFLESVKGHLNEDGVLIITTSNAFGILSTWRILKGNNIKVHGEHTCWYDPKTLTQLLERHGFEVTEGFFSNKSKWYLGKNFYKIKYQIPKLIVALRPYFSGKVIVVARLVKKP